MAEQYMSMVGESLEESNKRLAEVLNGSNSEPLVQTCSKSYSGEVTKGKDIFSSKKLSTTSNKISAGNIDKRVALTCAPKTSARDETLFVNKVKYVLGPKFYTKDSVGWLTSSKFYGSSSRLTFLSNSK